jgi:hypothetical protein
MWIRGSSQRRTLLLPSVILMNKTKAAISFCVTEIRVTEKVSCLKIRRLLFECDIDEATFLLAGWEGHS